MRIIDGNVILDEHTIFLSRWNECQYSESGGSLSDKTCYCNFWNAVIEIDGFCYKGRNSQLNRRE